MKLLVLKLFIIIINHTFHIIDNKYTTPYDNQTNLPHLSSPAYSFRAPCQM